MAAKLTEEVKVAAMLAKEQLEATVREAMLRGVQEGLGCEGDTETRPLIYRDSLRQGEPNRCDTLTQW